MRTTIAETHQRGVSAAPRKNCPFGQTFGVTSLPAAAKPWRLQGRLRERKLLAGGCAALGQPAGNDRHVSALGWAEAASTALDARTGGRRSRTELPSCCPARGGCRGPVRSPVAAQVGRGRFAMPRWRQSVSRCRSSWPRHSSWSRRHRTRSPHRGRQNLELRWPRRTDPVAKLRIRVVPDVRHLVVANDSGVLSAGQRYSPP